jgi:hypothetical protein
MALSPPRNTEEKDAAQNFSFKCHRQEPPSSTQSRLVSQQGGQETNIYAVNAISFNRMHGTFSTAGADGTLSFWCVPVLKSDSIDAVATHVVKCGS